MSSITDFKVRLHQVDQEIDELIQEGQSGKFDNNKIWQTSQELKALSNHPGIPQFIKDKLIDASCDFALFENSVLDNKADMGLLNKTKDDLMSLR